MNGGNPTVRRVLDQCAALDAIRLTQEGIWDELGGICFPRYGPISNRRQPQSGGRADKGRIAQNFDGTAMRACETLAKGQAARITPMGGRWFVLRPPQKIADSREAQNWFARCTEILISFLGASNFYNRAFQAYQERGGFGCSALETTSGANGRGLHFRILPVGTYAVAENSLDEVDVVYRTHYQTPAQLAGQFGAAALPEIVRKALDDPTRRHANTEQVIHALYPRVDRDPRKTDALNKAVASLHVHKGTETLLLESGFDSQPVAVSRWQTNPLSPYGWGPADYALPEAIQANFQEQMLDVLAETAAFPRLLVPAGMKDEIDFAAMGITMFEANAGEAQMPKEWLTQGRYDIGKDRAADKKKAIEQSFFVDLFTAISRLSPDATATQVGAIVSESRELFHPIFSNMVREFHTPVLRRCFALLMEQGEMPPPPAAVLQHDDLGAFIADPDVEYVSAMALALEQSHLSGFNEILSVFSPLAALDPAWLAGLSPERCLEYFIRAKGLPSMISRTPEEMQALAQQAQQAAQAQQAQQATEAVRNLGGVDETAKAAQMLQSPPQ
ncbi:MAG: hypothetical protein RLZZ522_535 [Verrucomicrobiota bacterium]